MKITFIPSEREGTTVYMAVVDGSILARVRGANAGQPAWFLSTSAKTIAKVEKRISQRRLMPVSGFFNKKGDLNARGQKVTTDSKIADDAATEAFVAEVKAAYAAKALAKAQALIAAAEEKATA